MCEVLQRITGDTLEAFSTREYGSDLAWRYAGPAAHTYWLGAERYLLNGANLAAGAGIAIVTNASRSLTSMVRRFAPLGSAIRRALPLPTCRC